MINVLKGNTDDIKYKIIKKDILFGSWAGAFGNFQFMPTSIKKYAIDYNKNNTCLIGDSINDFQISDGAILISHFKFDAAGNVYLCGTGNGSATIGGQPVGNDSTIISYSAFIAKLDSNFQQSWSDQFRYITIDFYPEMAFTSSRVAFLVDTIPQPNGIGNYHILKYCCLLYYILRRHCLFRRY